MISTGRRLYLARLTLNKLWSSILFDPELYVPRARPSVAGALPAPQSHRTTVRHATPDVNTLEKYTVDRLHFRFGYATYAHHGGGDVPAILSLTDLSDLASQLVVLPRRRPPGLNADTLLVRSGDDALIVLPRFLGVADGVLLWGELSKAGVWLRLLLENTCRNLLQLKTNLSAALARLGTRAQLYAEYEETIRTCMDHSFEETLDKMEDEGIEGLLTLLLAALTGSNLLVMSVGDCKLYVIRNGTLVETLKEQMTTGLCPQQLGTHHPEVMPSGLAWMHWIGVKKGDVVVVCSDGLSDNLWEDEIVAVVNEAGGDLQLAASELVRRATDVSFDNYAVCPYTEVLSEARGGAAVAGGKVDDISVCVAVVSDSMG